MSDLINEILEFAEDSTNVLTPEEYSVDAGRLAGHVPGRSRSNLENTALRQVSRLCRGVAQFIAEGYAPGVVDDGDLEKIVDGLWAAIAEVAPTPGPATTETAGISRRATVEEAVAGEAAEPHVTPEGLAAALAAFSSGPSIYKLATFSLVGR